MVDRWVVNASPIIVLAKVSREDLLFALSSQIVVPSAVAQELRVGPPHDRSRHLIEAGRFTIVDTPLPPDELLAWDLGAGETAAISLALAEPGWTVILDAPLAANVRAVSRCPSKALLRSYYWRDNAA
jgi:predicted nucleic acid-binding protein